MSSSAAGVRRSLWPRAALACFIAPLLVVLAQSLWHVPYAISETVGLLEDVQTHPLSTFLDPTHPYVRPAFYVLLIAILKVAGSLTTAAVWYKALHVLAVLAVVTLFAAQLRVHTPADAGAATVALAALVGSPGFRDNLENLPLNQMVFVMLLSLLAWMLAERSYRTWHDVAVIALVVAAIAFKEQGLIVAAAITTAWTLGAPGVNRRTALTVAVIGVVYVGFRVFGPGDWAVFLQDVGFGFSELKSDAAAARFGEWPYAFYAYNVLSTAGNILVAEPTGGIFRITASAMHGTLAPWEVNHVVSSLLLTGLLLWWGASAWRRRTSEAGARALRLFVVTAVVVAGSAALGFNYTRDRFGGLGALFCALAAFSAVQALLTRVLAARPGRLVAASIVLALLATGWQLRTIGTVLYLRETASKNQKEWLVDIRERRLEFASRPAYLATLEALVPQGIDPSATPAGPNPRWFAIFGQW